MHIDTELLDDGVYQTARARPVVCGVGPSAYYEISRDLHFDLTRPG